jgi:hypothetical protein
MAMFASTASVLIHHWIIVVSALLAANAFEATWKIRTIFYVYVQNVLMGAGVSLAHWHSVLH